MDPTSHLDRGKASKQTQSNHQGVYNRILATEVEEDIACSRDNLKIEEPHNLRHHRVLK